MIIAESGKDVNPGIQMMTTLALNRLQYLAILISTVSNNLNIIGQTKSLLSPKKKFHRMI